MSNKESFRTGHIQPGFDINTVKYEDAFYAYYHWYKPSNGTFEDFKRIAGIPDYDRRLYDLMLQLIATRYSIKVRTPKTKSKLSKAIDSVKEAFSNTDENPCLKQIQVAKAALDNYKKSMDDYDTKYAKYLEDKEAYDANIARANQECEDYVNHTGCDHQNVDWKYADMDRHCSTECASKFGTKWGARWIHKVTKVHCKEIDVNMGFYTTHKTICDPVNAMPVDYTCIMDPNIRNSVVEECKKQKHAAISAPVEPPMPNPLNLDLGTCQNCNITTNIEKSELINSTITQINTCEVEKTNELKKEEEDAAAKKKEEEEAAAAAAAAKKDTTPTTPDPQDYQHPTEAVAQESEQTPATTPAATPAATQTQATPAATSAATPTATQTQAAPAATPAATSAATSANTSSGLTATEEWILGIITVLIIISITIIIIKRR